jgi:hypothetical protein
MKKLIYAFLLLLAVQATAQTQKKLTAMECGGRGCSGSEYCTACKNCSGCKHCAKNGGSCGVCVPKKKVAPVKPKKKSTKKKTKK